MADKRFPDDYSEKTSIVGNDQFACADSAAADAFVKIKFSTIQNTIRDITGLSAKTTPIPADIFMIDDSADSNNPKKVTFDNIFNFSGLTAKSTPLLADLLALSDTAASNVGKKVTVQELLTTFILSGAGAPGSTPSFIGQRYIDTTGDREYYAVGTASSADWRKVGVIKYFTTTVTAGGGDVAVNFDIDITNALIVYARSGTAANYFQGALFDNGGLHVTSYDALSNAAYTLEHIQSHNNAGANWHNTAQKTNNVSGLAKSVTTTSVTFDDDGANTVYVKGFIIV